MKKITTLLTLLLLVVTLGACTQRTISADNLKRIETLRNEVAADLLDNLLPWWATKTPDYVNGGFYGRINAQDSVFAEADKGGILNARILWTFSAAYRITKDTSYLRLATRAKDYCIKHFIDKEFGGVYYALDYKGVPSSTGKNLSTHTHFINAFSEYARATSDREALETARALFETVEKHAFDKEANWYIVDFNREWEKMPRRVLVTTPPFVKARTNLYRVWPEERMAERLRFIVETFLDKIINPDLYHLNYVIDENWNTISEVESYGHDIEAAWMLREAALALGDPQLIKRVEDVSVKIAEAVTKGIQPDGTLIYEKDRATGRVNDSRSWWVQVETIVGYFDAWEISGEEKFLDIALNCWNFTRDNFIDKTNGGWFTGVTPDGGIRRGDKAAHWTCPQHNAGMAIEIMERVERLLQNR